MYEESKCNKLLNRGVGINNNRWVQIYHVSFTHEYVEYYLKLLTSMSSYKSQNWYRANEKSRYGALAEKDTQYIP